MSKRQDYLDRLQVTSPCSAEWERMSGDEQQRYCDECQRVVYDFSKMTRRQIEAIVATSRNRLCARLTREEDGSLLMLETPPVIHPANRRLLPIASTVMTALLSVNAVGVPQPLAPLSQAGSICAVQDAVPEAKKDDAQSPLGAATATVAGQVVDEMQVGIARAKVTLISDDTQEEKVVLSSAQGEYRFAQLLPGSYVLMVEAAGFNTTKAMEINLQAGQEQRLDVGLEKIRNVMGMIAMRSLPLRQLYQESKLVAVVSFGDSVIAEREGESRLMKTWLYLNSTLKGAWPGPAVPFYHWEVQDEPGEFEPGDKLLVFLNRRRSDDGKKLLDGYEASPESFGLKKLPETALNVYLNRLAELDPLLRQERIEKSDILEWLVRCAEDPATRWEGLAELTKTLDQWCELGATNECAVKGRKIDDTVKAALRLNQPQDNTRASDSQDGEKNNEEKIEDLKITTLLNKDQRARLLTALYKTEEIKGDDLPLIELAKDWDDTRLLPFLLKQLRHFESSPPRLAEELMRTIAEVLDDEEIEKLAEAYADEVKYDDLDEIDDELSADEKKAAAQTAAVALAARKAMLRKFISVAQRKVNLLAK